MWPAEIRCRSSSARMKRAWRSIHAIIAASPTEPAASASFISSHAKMVGSSA